MRKNAIILLIILFTSIVNIFSFKQGHDWGGDFAHYIAQSLSIIDGSISQFEDNYTFIFNESIDKPGPVFAPWGLPLLLIPILKTYGINMFVIKLYCYAFFLIALFFVYINFRDRIDITFLILVILILAFHPAFFSFKENIQADFSLFFFFYLSLYLIDNWILKRNYFINRPICYTILGIVLFLSMLIKTIGIILLLTMITIQILNVIKYRQYKKELIKYHIISSIPYVVIVMLLIIQNLILPSSHITYNLESDRSIINSILVNGSVYLENIYSFIKIFPELNLSLKLLNFSVFVFTLIMIGITLYKDLDNVLLYIIVSLYLFLILLPLPFNGGGFRYIIPFFPIYLFLSFKGFEISIGKINQTKYRMIIKGVIILSFSLLLGIIIYNSIVISVLNFQNKPLTSGPYSPFSQEMFCFVNNNTDENDIIVFFKPRVMNLYTKRKSFRLDNAQRKLDVKVIEDLGNRTWNYFIVNDSSKIKTYDSTKFTELVFQNGDFSIYKNVNISP